jgi:hypothetical protein
VTSSNLERLAQSGSLKQEPGDQLEFDGLVRSATIRLQDARLDALAAESRFDLAYNAAHAFALAALRWHGFRSESRYLVFQCLPHTLGVDESVWRVLAICHDRRNRAEYEGAIDIDDQLVTDLLRAAGVVQEKVNALGPVTPL